MQRPNPETLTLADILITEELSLRVPRTPNWQALAEAMRSLLRQMAQASESLMQTLASTALELCQAGTTGVSLLETTPEGAEIFRWNVLAGTLARHVGGSTPRHFSPCGACLDRGVPVLFSHPERYFTYFQEANTPIVEGLVLPLIADRHVFGTIWIMSHDEERHFDSEDVRVMTSLADFTATALLLKQRQTGELLAANVTLETEVLERKQAEARARALIFNLPGGAAFVVDRDLRYLQAQGEALATTGFKPEDFIGRTIFEVLSPDLAASYEPNYRQALAGEPFEHEHRTEDRTYISRGTPLRAENGEIYAVLVVSYDISDRKRAEEALRESEERFRAFVTASSDIVYRVSADWREMRSLVGKNFLVSTEDSTQSWIETYIPPEEQPRVWDAIQSAIDTKSMFELEHRVIQQDGAIGWTFSRAIPMLNEQGDIVEWFGTASDVTDRKQAEVALRETEARLAVELADAKQLQFISSQLVQEENIDTLYGQILEAEIALMRSDMGSMQLLHPDRNELQLLAWKGFDPASAAFWQWVRVDSDSSCGVALRTGERAIVPDVETCEFMAGSGDLDAYRRSGIRAVQTTPLISRSGQVVGMISTHWQEPHQPSERELGLLDVLARQAADLIKQRQAEAALRESEAKYRSLFETMDEGLSVLELIYDESGKPVDMRWVEANPAFEKITGLKNVAGRLTSEFVPTEDYWLETYDRVVKTGEPIRYENYHAGIQQWYRTHTSRVGGSESRQVANLFEDITDRKRRELNTAFLNEIGKELSVLSAPDEIIQTVGTRLGSFLQVSGCIFADVDEAKNEATIHHGWNTADVPSLKQTFRLADYFGEEFARAGRAGETVIVRDTGRDERANAEAYARLKIGGFVTVPFQRHGRWTANITVTSREPRDWRADEIELLQEIASRVFPRIDRARAEEALCESEEKFSALFASSPVPFMVLEPNPPDFTITAANEAYFAATLTAPEGLIGRRLFDVFTDDPNRPGTLGSEAFALSLNRVLTTRRPDVMDRTRYDIVTPDGRFEPHWWQAINAPLLNASGQVTAIIHQVTRVTELHLAEEAERENQERQAFLLKLSEILQRFVRPNDIKAAAMRLLGEHLGVSRAQYHECDSSGEYYSADGVGYANGLPLLDLKYRIDDFGTFVNEDFAAGRPYRSDDLTVDPRVSAEERDAYRTYQIGAGAGVPLIRGGKLVAILAIHDVHPHPWTDLEMDLIRETAERIWTPLERARAQEALRESEEKYRSLFTSIDEGFNLLEMISDESGHPSDFRIVETNPAWEQQTGLTDATGKTLLEIAPNFEQHWLDFYSDVVISGRGRRTEYYTASVDRWFTVYASRIGGEGSRQVAAVFNDITDRKRTEEQQAFLLKLSDSFRAHTSSEAIGAFATRMVAEYMHVDRCYIARFSREEERGWIGPEYRSSGLPPLSGEYRFADFPEGMKRLETNRLIIRDLLNDESLSETDKQTIGKAMGLYAMLAAVLRKGERNYILCLTAATTRPRDWTDGEAKFLEDVAERTWAAMERARTEVALREAELQRVREQSAREQERQRAESLAELDRAKTLFFTHVSHEFRTPLTLSLAPLQDVLSDPTLADSQRERLELVHRNSLRLLKLVNTLLDFSRIEAGRMEAVYEPTDLAMFTTELSSVFRSAIERAGLQLIVDCPPLPEPVFVDREMWEKIVLNLLSNAFKFTFEGAITVRLRPADAGDRAILQIQDTGTGIAPEHLPHLFERFYQVRGTQARTHEGSGIGLALVHELVRLHGGTIEVNSTLGEGTCFTIALPFGREHLPSDRLQNEGDRIQPIRTLASTAMGATAYVKEAERWLPEGNAEEASIPTPYSLLPTSLSARVLVIDDNADMREYLTRILSEHVQVEAVADGATALSLVQEQVPDLILSDVMMPRLDGFELLQALRASPRTREVPIIMLSARAGEEAIVVGLEAGADDYLIKPFCAQELVSRVIAHLQMAQLRGEALQQERIINRQKDEFISVVSHELNTPLVAILGWTRLLRSSSPSPMMLNKALDTIERNATLQAKLVQDLLDISRISAGKLRLNPQPIELKPVLETAIATVTQTAADKGIYLTWQENVTKPVVVMGDSARLSQVFTNLLTNAIKFTPEFGSVRVELLVINDEGSADASIAELRVTDTGIGIAADFLPHVFERFRQAEGENAAKGLGLGLAIARHIVELHNATIHAESAGEGQGATFTVRLPIL